MNEASKFYASLRADIVDGGQAAFERVSALARDHRELEIQSPAMAALAAWGDKGFRQMSEIALGGESSKKTSAALKALAIVASGNLFNGSLMFIIDPDCVDLINERVNAANATSDAKRHLAELVLSLPADDLLIPFGVALQQVSLVYPSLAEELVSALSIKWLRFGPQVVRAYEELLISERNNESAFQEFFCQYPQFLDPMALQVWSQPDFHGALAPDFVIRRVDDSYLVVEIECPGKQLITGGNQLGHHAVHAEKQATEYAEFLSDRLLEAQSHFPGFRDPDCLAVVGLETELSPSRKKALARTNAKRHKVRIVGFDWLADRAHSILTNMSSGEIEVIKGHRVI